MHSSTSTPSHPRTPNKITSTHQTKPQARYMLNLASVLSLCGLRQCNGEKNTLYHVVSQRNYSALRKAETCLLLQLVTSCAPHILLALTWHPLSKHGTHSAPSALPRETKPHRCFSIKTENTKKTHWFHLPNLSSSWQPIVKVNCTLLLISEFYKASTSV